MGLIDSERSDTLTEELCFHLVCPNCGKDIEVGPMSFERRKALVKELQRATRRLMGITP